MHMQRSFNGKIKRFIQFRKRSTTRPEQSAGRLCCGTEENVIRTKDLKLYYYTEIAK